MTRGQLKDVVSLLLLGEFIWAGLVLIPKARRQGETFAVVCAVSAALVALLGWLLIGSSVGLE